MRWFRANTTLGGRVALFALALQLVVSFGHIHRDDIYGAPQAATAANSGRQTPSHQPAQHGDDYCAICATIALLSHSSTAAPPQLLPPIVSAHAVAHADRVAIFVVAPPRAPFQSRAPPAA